MASFRLLKSAIFDREEKKQQYQAHIRGLNAYDRHKKFLNDYVFSFKNGRRLQSATHFIFHTKTSGVSHFSVGFYGKEKSTDVKLPIKTDHDTLREGYRFIRSEEDDMNHSWEQKLVKRYYDKLFKEYCIADMSQYKSGKIGLRWRTEKEVISGKGQFICGNKHCNEKDGLASYEVNFSYFEAGENKQALVKLVTCERCAEKLHYKKRKEEEKEKEKEKEKEFDRKQKKDYKRKRDQSKDKDDTDEERERSREKRKGKRASSSAINYGSDDDDEDFDKYLEGMFP